MYSRFTRKAPLKCRPSSRDYCSALYSKIVQYVHVLLIILGSNREGTQSLHTVSHVVTHSNTCFLSCLSCKLCSGARPTPRPVKSPLKTQNGVQEADSPVKKVVKRSRQILDSDDDDAPTVTEQAPPSDKAPPKDKAPPSDKAPPKDKAQALPKKDKVGTQSYWFL